MLCNNCPSIRMLTLYKVVRCPNADTVRFQNIHGEIKFIICIALSRSLSKTVNFITNYKLNNFSVLSPNACQIHSYVWALLYNQF
mgnify:CR=1 FL=1